MVSSASSVATAPGGLVNGWWWPFLIVVFTTTINLFAAWVQYQTRKSREHDRHNDQIAFQTIGSESLQTRLAHVEELRKIQQVSLEKEIEKLVMSIDQLHRSASEQGDHLQRIMGESALKVVALEQKMREVFRRINIQYFPRETDDG